MSVLGVLAAIIIVGEALTIHQLLKTVRSLEDLFNRPRKRRT